MSASLVAALAIAASLWGAGPLLADPPAPHGSSSAVAEEDSGVRIRVRIDPLPACEGCGPGGLAATGIDPAVYAVGALATTTVALGAGIALSRRARRRPR